MKLNQKAQHLIEYMLLMAAVVAGVLGVVSPSGPMKGAVDRSLNRAVDTIYGDYFWKLGPLSVCSVFPGCGDGTATRTVQCSDGTGKIVADGLCAGKGAKPGTTVPCNIPCGGNAWWQSGWGPCSAACGPGVQTQTVECHDSGGNTIADALCGGGKPPTSQACDNGCFVWVAGMTCTGLCSEPCGIGTCPRSVVCQDSRTSIVVPDANCSGPKPGATIACNTAIACGYQWVVDDWGNCDQSCGPGFKHRLVQCRRIADNAVMPDSPYCDPAGPKPTDQLACNLGPCNHWGVTNWTKCTKPCGTGTQDADVKCYDKDNNVQADANCPLAESGPKPASRRDCNIGACLWGNAVWGPCTGGTNCGFDGTYSRLVWCYHGGPVDPEWGAKFDIVWCIGAAPGADQNVNNPPGACNGTTFECTQTRTCQMKCYGWVNDGNWGSCSTTCGTGIKSVTPRCYESTVPDGYVADGLCLLWAGPKPPDYTQACSDTSSCCGNGVCDNFPGIPYAEVCGTCSNDCGPCAGCTYPAGSSWTVGPSTCTADAAVSVAHGVVGTANDTGSPTIGSISAKCNNGVWDPPSSQTCATEASCTFPAGSAWTVGTSTCNASAAVTVASGSTGTATDSGAPTTGSITALCLNGSWQPPSSQTCVTSAFCGDGSCNGTETCDSCPGDCGACAGCTFPVGSAWNVGGNICNADSTISVAHNATGTATDSGSPTTGSITAKCRNGVWDPPTAQSCSTGAFCGDGSCNGTETCATCSGDCGACPTCGDGSCNGTETCSTCPGDCGACAPVCGDGRCNGAETCATCPGDCGACAPVCGDGRCNGSETCATCPGDCGACAPVCGDGRCNGSETCATCPGDCGSCAAPCSIPASVSWGVGCSAGGSGSVPDGGSTCLTDSTGPSTGSICADCHNGSWTVTSQPCSCAGLIAAGQCYRACVCESCAANGWNCGFTNCGQRCGTGGCIRDWSCVDHRCECMTC